MQELWYDKPASYWEEALPLGNGRIGAMVWGGTGLEQVSLNEDSLWSGYPQDHNIPGAAAHYNKARDLAMAGRYKQAEQTLERHTLGHFTQCYLPMGELQLHFPASGEVSGYRRALDLETAVASVAYRQNGVGYTRESFVSAKDQALVMRIAADTPGAVSLTARFTCQLRASATAQGTRLVLEGIAPSEGRPAYVETETPMVYEDDPAKRGMRFVAMADFEAEGGTVTAQGGAAVVKNAHSVVIRLCARTSFNGSLCHPFLDGAPFEENCEADLAAAKLLAYSTLRDRHIRDYKALYNRVELDFGPGRDEVPLPLRLAGWETAEKDPALMALLFQFGRYLLIASSRPGTLPTNLQGIWNQHLRAPWSGNYTTNINAQMNYWPAEVANLSECHEPLLAFLDTLRVTGAKTAGVHYGARGMVVHHNSDIWGHSSPVGEAGEGTCSYAFWPMAAGWLSAHAFAHYSYTLDEEYLASRGWPVIRDAARFYLDVMVEDTDGTLVFAAGTSPENRFIKDGERLAVSKTNTMAVAIIRETLANAVRCCYILGVEPEFRDEAAAALGRLPAYGTGSRGQLLEWSEEWPESEPGHRHQSHLYPLYPGHDITPEHTPELAAACKKTLDLRGEDSTGWALAWRISLWARLGEGERAFALLKKQVRPADTDTTGYTAGGGCCPNLFGACPPFQIDSNFGACAGIAELLLYSHEDVVTLLPALPKALGSGHVKGLRAWGGVTVDIRFCNGAVEQASLALDANVPPRNVRLRLNGRQVAVGLAPGQKVAVGAYGALACP